MLQMQSVSKVFRTEQVEPHALRSLDLHVREGEFVAVTGPSGSGKTTFLNIAGLLETFTSGTYLLDGDNIRHGLSDDLGFSAGDRAENIRRIAEVARLMVDAGLVVLAAFVSPYRAERDAIRARFADGEFIEVFVDTPLAACEARDPKGLYKKARAGEIRHFTGIDDPYEAPLQPEIRLVNDNLPLAEGVARLLSALQQHGVLP